ncbi:hypothetical protein RD110_05390 [Rhodoferax koreense]|uniref:Peptidase S54 rhomboid domain-containing protein n=1 Tax=Rhodoferax koreensis TaxID=1842727 RepID=A0A1P8JSI7_9BURK|nr:rhomboid family intramembrane serine protease [Rhodoferax koreense]APW36695.1 hypothetical protein RD110_05390 [Rhodoferax koreense]
MVLNPSPVSGPAAATVVFLPTLRRQSLLLAVLTALFGGLLSQSLVEAMRGTGSQWLGVAAGCAALVTLWLAARLVHQAIGRQPVLRLDARGIGSTQLPAATNPLAWDWLEDAELDRAHGGQLRLVLRPDPARPDRRHFLSGRNPARPVINLHMLTPEQQDEAFDAIHRRLAPLRAAAGLGEAASLVQARATAQFEHELDRLTPHTWALYLVVATNVAVWGLQLADGISPTTPKPAQLHQWGANSAAAVLLDREYWRLLTAPFLHGGASHLGFNMLALWAAGRQLSRLLGNAQFGLVYLATALCGSVASLHSAGQSSVSVGASGAVFGVLGALLAASLQYRHRLPPHDSRRLWAGLGLFVVYSLAYGFTQSNVDNAAHVGGLVAGLLLGLLLKGRFDLAAAGQRPAYAGLAMAGTAAAVVFGVMTTPVPQVWPGAIYEAQESLRVITPQFHAVFQGLELAGQRRQQGQINRRQYLAYAEQVAAPQCQRIAARLRQLRVPQWDNTGQAVQLYRRMCEIMAESIGLELRKAREGAYAPADLDARMRVLADEMTGLARRLNGIARQSPAAPQGR